ncbi:MAG: ferredoxin reductase family protein [Patescibacteria group bacterium]
MKTKYYIGNIIIIGIIVIPLILWLWSAPWVNRFYSPEATLTSLGQMCGLVGMSLMALVLILSSRLRILERFFPGMNRVYSEHHWWGGLAFILLLAHPLLLAGKYWLFSVQQAAWFLLPGVDRWPINFGIIALTLMIIFLFLTFFGSLAYQTWRWTHKFMGLVLIMALIHLLTVSSDTANYLPLRMYFIILSAVALLLYFYRSWLDRWLVPKYAYTVKQVKKYGPDIVEILMRPDGEKMKYQAGQFAFLEFESSTVTSEVHPFSISSAPTENTLRIAVKNLGDYTSQMSQIKNGDKVRVEGPFGCFNRQQAKHQSQVWIAGGIGITPFLGMARSLPTDHPSDINLIYAVKKEGEAVFYPKLERIATAVNNFHVTTYYSDQSGHLTVEAIKKMGIDPTKKSIFICGPGLMMASLKKQLRQAGVPADCIHTEEFELYND